MRPQQMKHRLVITSVTAAAAAALLLSGCGQNQSQGATTPAPTSSSPSSTSSQSSSASPSQMASAGADGEPIGAAATRDDSTPVADVLLAPGQAGTATLRYTQAGNYPNCTRTPAAGFRVYPPEDTASLFLAAPKDACSNAGINLLTIGAFTAM